MKNQVFNYLTVGFLCIFFFVSCSKEKDKDSTVKPGTEITATFQFSNGESTDFAFTSKKDDFKSYVNGPNGNEHYKMYLRGEKQIGDKGYTINIYVTMPEKGVGDYPFGKAGLNYDDGFVTEIILSVVDNNNPLMFKQYGSRDADNTNSKGLTISSLTDNHVKGTFSGAAAYKEDTVEIVDGKFDIAISRGDWED